MEEQQEMAHSARAKVVSKLQGTLALKTDKYTKVISDVVRYDSIQFRTVRCRHMPLKHNSPTRR